MEVENGMGSFLYRSVFYARKGSFDTSLRKPKPRRSLEMEEHGNNNCGGDLAENQDFEGVILEIFTSKICQIILEVRVSCHHFREHPYLTRGVTIWRYILGSLFMPLEISANHMGDFWQHFHHGALCPSSNKSCQAVFV